MSDYYSGPPKPKTFSVRPLTKGMVRNLPTALLPDGAAFDLAEAHLYSEGLERRDGYKFAFQAAEGVPVKVNFVFSDEVVQDYMSYWTTAGSKQLLCLTNRVLYLKTADVWEPVHWCRAYTVSSLVSATITDSTGGRNFTTDFVVAGMYAQLYNTVTSAYEYYRIDTVNTASLVLASAPAGTYSSTFYVIKRFTAENPFIVDWVTTPTRIYYTDGYATGVDYWNGTFLNKLNIKNSSSADVVLGARTIDYIGDRLFLGYCTDVGPEIVRNRIRWSTALNDARFEDDAYQDLADFGGEIIKLKVLGQFNICYLSDGVAFGRQSNLASLPYVFNKVETGSIGVVGPRAVTGYLDMHFYVGVDDIYSLAGDLVPKRLGTAVNKVSLQTAQVKSLTLARIDPQHRRVLFGFALDQNLRIDTYYAFYYETQAWARHARAWAAISAVPAATIPVLGDYPSTDWDGFPGKTFASFGGDVAETSVYYADFLGFTYQSDDTLEHDETPVTVGDTYEIGSTPITFVFESKDFDFEDPDLNKSLIRLGVRITDNTALRTIPIMMTALGSTDRGRTWKSLGTLNFRTDDDEAKLNFRLTGPTIRYRLTSSSEVPPYRVEEHTLRLRSRGLEGQRGDNA